ncbi:adenosylcobinamide-phosphate synthase CbiB [Paludicola sp. MB14-C6]|uniref:adenosylcobinamide-phosphate synthase CbiB n=1 Tax=Paludihabitans sp. MB14-C6 TaxID=3070656 RepID=UPI0027DB4D84|nr:adenosylcobinamide-phosphate synthase CbiB [Paludicola sp. MB14-C6]WMJ22049.1 adenosylcobinamide-phosphate synthase CbiB [Paludicola sp. MB14-C6]
MEILVAVIIGFILDLIIGDPQWLPHPVRLIGFLIAKGEKIIRKILPKKEFIGGMILTVLVTAISFVVPYFILYFAGLFSIYLKIAIEAVFCYQILATKCLKVESMRVYQYLIKKDILNSRKYLSWIVGRDTENLDEQQISKAVVETIAENTSDGVIAPMIFLVIGGAPLGFFYKAVNTLDSMIGYKNDKYLYFGRFAAKLDDVLNFLPAIISAMFMIAASFIVGLDSKNAVKIYKRDKHNHSSPNSAKTEAVAAGALNLMLAGDAYYFGKLVKKKTIGDDNKTITPQDIPTMNKLMYATATVSILILSAIRLTMVILL